jgi:uncharacterized alpha/beta hydrolase family protein
VAAERTLGGNSTLFVGEDKTLTFELSPGGVPVDAATWVVLFDVRVKDNSPSFILQKLATVTGAFNVDRALNQQRAVVQLDDDMNKFKARSYRYSLKRMDDGSETVMFHGDFAPEKATAP